MLATFPLQVRVKARSPKNNVSISRCLPRLLVQLIRQMGPDRRPFGSDDAVDHGIAQRSVGRDLVVAQNTVELGAETFDAAPGLLIEKMRAELDRDATELVESMREQQQFALGIERAALHALGIPGRSDLDAAVGGVDVHIGRHARALLADVLGPRDQGVPELPQFAVFYGRRQAVEVLVR